MSLFRLLRSLKSFGFSDAWFGWRSKPQICVDDRKISHEKRLRRKFNFPFASIQPLPPPSLRLWKVFDFVLNKLRARSTKKYFPKFNTPSLPLNNCVCLVTSAVSDTREREGGKVKLVLQILVSPVSVEIKQDDKCNRKDTVVIVEQIHFHFHSTPCDLSVFLIWKMKIGMEKWFLHSVTKTRQLSRGWKNQSQFEISEAHSAWMKMIFHCYLRPSNAYLRASSASP